MRFQTQTQTPKTTRRSQAGRAEILLFGMIPKILSTKEALAWKAKALSVQSLIFQPIHTILTFAE